MGSGRRTVHAQCRAGGQHAERVGTTHGPGRRGRGCAAGQRALHEGTDIALFGARGAQLVGQRRGVGLGYEVAPLVQVLLHVGLLGFGLGLGSGLGLGGVSVPAFSPQALKVLLARGKPNPHCLGTAAGRPLLEVCGLYVLEACVACMHGASMGRGACDEGGVGRVCDEGVHGVNGVCARSRAGVSQPARSCRGQPPRRAARSAASGLTSCVV